ncbi:hypothetical protein KIN20_026019 [Parelaphostrongylus tenuis]|uniref:Uncharacterized protein n=1 Tax=Parelaphostrongylus tenuis TaxID=148309 RepID=A0AAD5N9F3_PARTN|nr:hypothetical protein KIN20_026019 [Parelaphostrongylus tenuis]
MDGETKSENESRYKNVTRDQLTECCDGSMDCGSWRCVNSSLVEMHVCRANNSHLVPGRCTRIVAIVQRIVRVVESVVRQGGFEELAWTIEPLYAKQDYQSKDK